MAKLYLIHSANIITGRGLFLGKVVYIVTQKIPRSL